MIQRGNFIIAWNILEVIERLIVFKKNKKTFFNAYSLRLCKSTSWFFNGIIKLEGEKKKKKRTYKN